MNEPDVGVKNSLDDSHAFVRALETRRVIHKRHQRLKYSASSPLSQPKPSARCCAVGYEPASKHGMNRTSCEMRSHRLEGKFPPHARQERQASSVITQWTRNRDQKSPVRRCFKSCPPLGGVHRCNLWLPVVWINSLASCPDSLSPTHDHRHVRNWASGSIRFFTSYASGFLSE